MGVAHRLWDRIQSEFASRRKAVNAFQYRTRAAQSRRLPLDVESSVHAGVCPDPGGLRVWVCVEIVDSKNNTPITRPEDQCPCLLIAEAVMDGNAIEEQEDLEPGPA